MLDPFLNRCISLSFSSVGKMMARDYLAVVSPMGKSWEQYAIDLSFDADEMNDPGFFP
jgi:hypothetical protein